MIPSRAAHTIRVRYTKLLVESGMSWYDIIRRTYETPTINSRLRGKILVAILSNKNEKIKRKKRANINTVVDVCNYSRLDHCGIITPGIICSTDSRYVRYDKTAPRRCSCKSHSYTVPGDTFKHRRFRGQSSVGISTATTMII